MNLNSMKQVDELRSLVESHFGFFPENVIIESPEIVYEAINQMNFYNQPKPTSLVNLRICGVRVAKEITEIETIE